MSLRSRRRRARLRARAAEAGVSVGEVRAADAAVAALLDDLYPLRTFTVSGYLTDEMARRFVDELKASSRLFAGAVVLPADADVRVVAVGGEGRSR